MPNKRVDRGVGGGGGLGVKTWEGRRSLLNLINREGGGSKKTGGRVGISKYPLISKKIEILISVPPVN